MNLFSHTLKALFSVGLRTKAVLTGSFIKEMSRSVVRLAFLPASILILISLFFYSPFLKAAIFTPLSAVVEAEVGQSDAVSFSIELSSFYEEKIDLLDLCNLEVSGETYSCFDIGGTSGSHVIDGALWAFTIERYCVELFNDYDHDNADLCLLEVNFTFTPSKTTSSSNQLDFRLATTEGDQVATIDASVLASPPAILALSHTSYREAEGSVAAPGKISLTLQSDRPVEQSITLIPITRNSSVEPSATVGEDYVANTESQLCVIARCAGSLPKVTLMQGTSSVDFTIELVGDEVPELDEYFTVDLIHDTRSGPIGNATLANLEPASITIVNDDEPPTVSFSLSNFSVSEGSQLGGVVLELLSDRPLDENANITYETTNGSAKLADDFDGPDGSSSTVTMLAGSTTAEIFLDIIDDSDFEGDETFLVGLIGTEGPIVLGEPDQATVTIVDNDPEDIQLRVDPPQLAANVTGETSFTAEYTLTNDGSSAVDGTHFARIGPPSGYHRVDVDSTCHILQPQESCELTLVFSDLTGEPFGESFEFTLGYFDDDEVLARFPFSGTVDEAVVPGILAVSPTSLSWPTTVQVGETSDATFEIVLQNTLAAGTDGGQSVSQITFGSVGPLSVLDVVYCPTALVPGESAQLCELNMSIDALGSAGNNTYDLPVTYFNGQDSVATSIVVSVKSVDAPVIAFGGADTEVTEGEIIEVSIVRTGDTDVSIEVEIDFSGNAVLGSDFEVIGGASDFNGSSIFVDLAQGQTVANVRLEVSTDSVPEPSETIVMTITRAVAFDGPESISVVAIGENIRTITLLDKSAPGQVQFSQSDYSFNEGDGTVDVEVQRINGTDGDLQVDYSFEAIAPLDNSDFTDVTPTAGTLTFNSGEVSSQIINIELADDDLVEPTESFTITLFNLRSADSAYTGIGASLGNISTTTVAIENNDTGVSTLALSSRKLRWPTPVETGSTATQDFGVTFANVAADISGGDISAITFGDASPVTVSAEDCADSLAVNETATCTISLHFDSVDSTGELNVVLPVSYFDGKTTLTASIEVSIEILNSGSLISLASASGNVVEGEVHNAVVTRSAATSAAALSAVTINFSVLAVPASGAESGVDFVEVDSGTLNWAVGDDGVRNITVETLSDDVFGEAGEQLIVSLSDPDLTDNNVLGESKTLIDIVDNTNPGELAFALNAVSISEDQAEVAITVNRSAPAEGVIFVNYSTVEGTAFSPEDFTAVNGTLAFDSGQTTRTFSVPINPGNDFGDETFEVVLSGATQGVGISVARSTVTIVDTTEPSVFSLVSDGFTVEESAQLGIPVRRATSQGLATVNFTVSGLGGASANDYVLLSPADGVLRFKDGQTQQTIELLVVDDDLVEMDETIAVTLTGTGPGSSIDGNATAAITIIDTSDTGQILFSQDFYSVNENAGIATVSVSRVPVGTGSVAGTAVVNIAVSNGSATGGDDFTGSVSSFKWADGETGERTFQIPLLADELIEGTETLSITLSNPQPASVLLDSPATLSIVDTSSAEAVVLTYSGEVEFTVGEGDGTVEIPIVRSGDTQSHVILSYEVGAEGSSASSADYVLQSDDLVWEPGVAGEQSIEIDITDDKAVESELETIIVRFLQATAAWPDNLIDPPGVPMVNIPAIDLVISIDDNEDRPILRDDGTPVAPVYVVKIEDGDNQNPTVVPSLLNKPLTVRVFNPANPDQPVPSIDVVWEIVPDPRVETTATVAQFVQNGGQTLTTTTNAEGVGQVQIEVLRRGFIGVRVTPQINLPVAKTAALAKRTVRATTPVIQLQEGAALFNIIVGSLQAGNLNESEFEVASAINLACDEIENAEVVLETQQEQNFGELCNLEDESEDNIRQALDRLATEETFTLGDSVLSLSNIQVTNVYSRINAIRSGMSNPIDASGLSLNILGIPIPAVATGAMVNLVASGGNSGGDPIGLITDWGFFVNGSVNIGEADGTVNEIGQEFYTRGLTAGADYRVRSKVVVGGALGFSTHESEFSSGGGETNQNGQYLSLFGTWFDEKVGYLDGIIEVGRNTFDIRRRLDLGFSEDIITSTLRGDGSEKFADGDTNASSFALTFSAGYDFNRKGWSIGTYGRVSLTAAEIDNYSEDVSDLSDISSGWALDVDSHRVLSTQLSLGGQVSKTINTRYGVFVPQFRLEGQVEFEDRPDGITARFQSDPLGTAFTIEADENESSVFNYGLGGSAVFPNGRSAFLFYEGQAGSDNLTIHSVKGGYRMEF